MVAALIHFGPRTTKMMSSGKATKKSAIGALNVITSEQPFKKKFLYFSGSC